MDKLLVDVLKDEQTWADLVEAMNFIFTYNVEDPTRKLLNVRSIDQYTESDIVYKTARLLGFDVSQDVLALSKETLGKIVTQLPHYADYKGTPDFYKFIDLLIHGESTITYLYSKDYVNFYDEPQGTMITEGGEWFKTTHIDLVMALAGLSNIVLNTGETLYKRVQDIFWNFAPITLVIRKFGLKISFDVQLGIAAKMIQGDMIYTIRSR